MTIRSALFILVALVCPVESRGDDKEKVSDPLLGEWVAVRVLGPKGEEVPKEDLAREPVTWTFRDGGKAVFGVGAGKDRTEIAYKYKTDPAKSPATVDLTDPDGRQQLGIYKVEKGRLTLCLSDPFGAKKVRPKEFAVGDEGIMLEMVRPAKK